MKTCEYCGKEFEPKRLKPQQRFCCEHCGQMFYRRQRRNFKVEWKSWKRDFALGKTASNL